MKKSLTILCTLLMMITSTATMFADENNIVVEENKTVDVELYAEVTSTYSVKIPKKFDVKETETNLVIYAKGDITANERLAISYKNQDVALSETAKSADDKHPDVPLTLTGDAVSFSWDQIRNDYPQNSSLTINIKHAALKAGYWSTNLPITIALNTITA